MRWSVCPPQFRSERMHVQAHPLKWQRHAPSCCKASTSGVAVQQPSPCRRASQRRRSAAACAASKQQAEEEVPDITYGFVGKNQGLFRALPLYAGGAGILGLLANRLISGIAPVVDASSSQSRADVLGIILSAVLVLTGLQWLSLKPRVLQPVALEGQEVYWTDPDTRLPKAAQEELRWAWEALRSCTRIKSLVLILEGRTLLHAGFVRAGGAPGNAKAGDICESVVRTQQGNYLANLVLYPGRLEFTSFLPENTQGVVVQPVGSRGVLIAGCDTVRGVGRLDQAWVASIADKLEVTLEDVKVARTGTGFGAAGAAGASSSSKMPAA